VIVFDPVFILGWGDTYTRWYQNYHDVNGRLVGLIKQFQ